MPDQHSSPQLLRAHEALSLIESQLHETPGYRSPVAWRREGARLGTCGLDLPPGFGGTGLTCTEMAELFTRCGEIDLDLRDVPGAGHARMISLAEVRSQEQDALLSAIVNGTAYCAVAITEETGGSDLHALRTVAVPTPGGYRLTGTKKFVARLPSATHVLVFAKVANPESHELSVFLLPTDAAGVQTEQVETLGLHGACVGAVSFDEVRLDQSAMVGCPGQGIDLFAASFSYWKTATAAAALGCARGAVKQAIERLKTRRAFGGPIGRFTHLQQELARHVAQLRMGALLVTETMSALDQRHNSFVQSAMAKAEVVESALAATDWAMRVHGALGYSTELDLEKRFRDLAGLRVADGPTDVLRGIVARSLLGDAIYEQSLGRDREFGNVHPDLMGELLS